MQHVDSAIGTGSLLRSCTQLTTPTDNRQFACSWGPGDWQGGIVSMWHGGIVSVGPDVHGVGVPLDAGLVTIYQLLIM